jgi:alpha-tubulin suppressor-like RCC1 family protein
MGIARRPWRLGGLAGCAAMVLGLVAAGSPAAHAVTIPVFNPNAAASWGAGGAGELGDGTLTSRDVPGTVNGLTSGVLQVAAGNDFGFAITTGGNVWAWGDNSRGQLGDGNQTSRSTPIQVPGLSGVRQVAGGLDHSLALKSDGTVWAWGSNEFGQVGIGVTGGIQLTPIQVPGLTGITKIAAGEWFSVALRSDGTVWAWGTGDLGEFGNGSTANSPSPQLAAISQVTSIAAGYDAVYAVRTVGTTATLWDWGGNLSGDLGDGTQTERLTPEQVTGPITASNIAQVSAGNQFAVALTTTGQVWGWGTDQFGELGNTPTHNLVTRPIQVVGVGSGITQLSAGLDHVLARTSGGGVLAWGDNNDGQLGDGSTAPVVGPVRVGLSGASWVAAGALSSFAVYDQPLIAP